jgi:hypothetical protein
MLVVLCRKPAYRSSFMVLTLLMSAAGGVTAATALCGSVVLNAVLVEGSMQQCMCTAVDVPHAAMHRAHVSTPGLELTLQHSCTMVRTDVHACRLDQLAAGIE